MAYDPTKPANGAQVASAELRNQFAGLKDLIDQKVTTSDLVPTIQTNSAGPIAGVVDYLSLRVSDPPSADEVQAIADKIDELITALRRA